MGVEVDRRKRARLSLPKKMRDKGVVAPDLNEERIIPNGFLCPLTMEAMFDPVLDAEGNTFERASLIQWLKQSPTSPISRQPLSKRMVIANNALRDAIHEFMGPSWVQQKIMASIGDNEEELKISAEIGKKADEEKAPSRLRSKIDCFLQNTCNELGGLNLQLNKDGCCAFRYDNITIVLDVPDQIGVFCLYTKDLLQGSNLDQDALCKRAMELNFLQGDTRGGCLALRENGERQEIMFSYTDRVPEVSARDFSNILLNFVETAVTLRNKLMPGAAETEPQQQAQQQQPQWWEDEGEEEGVVSEGDECVH